jgi:hypothetical protein
MGDGVSWHPLRDSFDLLPETQAVIRALSERIDGEAREELHRDLCGCQAGNEDCTYGPVNVGDAPSEFVIAWLLRERLITPERLTAS